MAIYRLSSLAAQGPTLVEQLVSIAIRTLGSETTTALLSSDQLDEELARQMQKDLATIAPYANVTNCIDQFERLSFLSAIIHMRLYGIDVLSEEVSSGDRSPMNYASIDWNIILRHANEVYDEAVAALRVPDRAGREQAIKRLYDKLDDSRSRLRQPGRAMDALFSRSARSAMIGTILTNLVVPALDAAIAAEERTNAMLMLEQFAAAIAVYRIEHGAYPQKFDDLVPDVLDKLPVDLYHAKPFVYKRADQGYLLYTMGENGVDDGGSNDQMDTFKGRSLNHMGMDEADSLRMEIPNGADDYSIRVPASRFELAKPSSPDEP